MVTVCMSVCLYYMYVFDLYWQYLCCSMKKAWTYADLAVAVHWLPLYGMENVANMERSNLSHFAC